MEQIKKSSQKKLIYLLFKRVLSYSRYTYYLYLNIIPLSINLLVDILSGYCYRLYLKIISY